jgi:hypothetical protein
VLNNLLDLRKNSSWSTINQSFFVLGFGGYMNDVEPGTTKNPASLVSTGRRL